ncbi:GntR family transcriptional regulator (plasmid) [Rhizobium sp. 32-5/1]|uniref:GntR family transcriptional regulator n=1 Tax=Rhizobium sp. 32-5/1 TaxID=3019602 RepID=UPI00240E4295|nr:GntR family transcriptional regulator [Rhizobium sp. 32-5/1]WEZ85477.1 GntR family transcriptional regulator [Rhizobium sp. 32-5/1]
MAPAALQKQTLSHQVADLIRSRILSGQYPSGAQLRQEHIAAEQGVSRIPVREALHQLHSEGFVTLVSHKGAIVSEVSLGEILELIDLRVRIETWLLSLAIPNLTQEDLDRALVAAERFGSTKGRVYSHELNWEFHSIIYSASHRLATIELLFSIHEKIERYTKMMLTMDAERQPTSHVEHLNLIEMCRKKDTLRAVALLEMHISEGGKQLAQQLEDLSQTIGVGRADNEKRPAGG